MLCSVSAWSLMVAAGVSAKPTPVLPAAGAVVVVEDELLPLD